MTAAPALESGMSALAATMWSVPGTAGGLAPLTPLVGRSSEVERLTAAVGLHDGTGPGGAAVLVSGDAGVGKTRLLAELRDKALAAEWRVLVGHCLDFGDSALPYLPFTEALGRLALDAPPVAESLVAGHPGLARLLPGHRLLRGQGDATGSTTRAVATEVRPNDATASGPVGRGELFDAVQSGLGWLAGSQPVLLVVEDLHWADQSTREMLGYLFARGVGRNVAVVASYRSDDLHRRHPLRAALAEWSRLPNVVRLQLGRLPDADVRTLVGTLHRSPLSGSALQEIVTRAEGNAFFTEELVAAAERGGPALPADLADLLLVRLESLDDETRAVVRAAAVAGRRVSHRLLARVANVDEALLDRALRSAVDGNVLVPLGDEGYAFRHALLAEAVYDDLLPGERVRLHARYVDALVTGDVEGTAAELARHARMSHDIPTAITASVRAGDEAMAVGGPDEALQHYELALAMLADRHTERIDVSLVDLTYRAAEAAIAAGHPHRAVNLGQDQLEAAGPEAPAHERAKLLYVIAAAGVLAEGFVDVLAHTTEALQLVPDEPLTPLRARLAAAHARASMERRRDDDAARWAHKAVAYARELRLPEVLADASTTLALVAEIGGDPASKLGMLERSVADARASGVVAGELRGLFNIGTVHFELGRLHEAREAYGEAVRRGQQAGRPWAPYSFDSRLMISIVCYVLGEWDRVLQTLDATGEYPPPMAEAGMVAGRLVVAAGRGETAAVEELARLRPAWERDGLLGVLAGAAAIDLYGDAQDVSRATKIYDEVVATVTRLWQVPSFQAQIRLGALLVGQLATEAGRPGASERPRLVDQGGELLARATGAADDAAARGHSQGPEGTAWLSRLRAEGLRLRWLARVDVPGEDVLVAAWRQAVADFAAFGHVFETARSQARLAAVLRAAGGAEEARALVQQATATARGLGAQPLLSELRVLGAGGGGPGRRSAPSTRQDESLTAREEEVLALVAAGRSNSEIGRQLYISAKTVSVHVSNILAKLGAAGRTEAVAVARRRGLLDD